MSQETDANLEINLGKYIEILFRQWRLIGISLIVCAGIAAILSYLKPSSYEARVIVATTKIASSVTFGSSIETLSEGQLPVTLVDRKARLQSYVALVANPTIADKVYDDLKDEFDDKLPQPESLLKMVSGSVLTGSDAIEIKVAGTDPNLVQAIANAWGRHYVDHVNHLYAIGSFEDTLLNIQRQAKDAQAKLLEAEQDYITFLESSPIEEYLRIREELIRVDRLLVDARGLLEQVEAGGEGAAASNALAVSVLKTQVFASTISMDRSQSSSGTSQFQVNPITLQFQADSVSISSQDLVTDINSLVNTLENRSLALLERVDFLAAQQPSQSTSASIDPIQSLDSIPGTTVEDKIRLLTSRIETVEGRRKNLVLTRDLSWDAYQNLATKEAELVIASQTGGQEVVLASTSNVTRNGSSLTRNTALAALIGLTFGIFLAFFVEYWWTYKGQEPQAIIGWNFGGREGKRS
jgi:capsular polysaccharide biosynthesis protein